MSLRQTWSSLSLRLTRLLHIDVTFYAKSIVWIVVAHSTGIIRGVATTFLMGRWLAPQTFGQFRYILAVFGIAGIFSLTGINQSVIRGIAKGDTVIAWAAFKRILSVSPLGSAILLLAAAERLWRGESIVAAGLAGVALLFPFYSVSGLYGPILNGKGEVTKLMKIAIMNNLVFSLCFVLIITHTKHLLPVLLAYLGFDILFRGSLTWHEICRLPKVGTPTEHLRLGTHLSGISAMQALASQLDQILIQYVGGYGTLASYSIATLIPEQIKDLANSWNGIILRRFSQYQKNQETLRATKRHFWLTFLLSAIIVGCYAILIPLFLPRLFPQYQNQVLPSIIYSLGLLAMPAMIGLNYFQAHNQIRALWRFNIVNAMLQISSNLVLIPLFGSWGAILSKTLTRFGSTMFAYPTEIKQEAR